MVCLDLCCENVVTNHQLIIVFYLVLSEILFNFITNVYAVRNKRNVGIDTDCV